MLQLMQTGVVSESNGNSLPAQSGVSTADLAAAKTTSDRLSISAVTARSTISSVP